jgi:ribosome-associated translation inhibitor RaiA
MSMKSTETAPVRVEIHGRVPDGSRELAAAKVGSLLQLAAEPVLAARAMLAVAADPAVARPALAQVTVDVNGRIVRAQAAEQTMRAAIEQMAARLRVRLARAARNWAALRGTVPAREPGEWRHQSIPARRPAYFPRPSEERDVVRHASYAGGRETPEEAAAELNLLDYDFHLFTERSTGQDSVIYRTTGGYRLAMAHPKPGRLGPVPDSMTVSKLPAPRLTVEEAAKRLEAMGRPFMFFIDTYTGRGSLIYHRYDGHYGLIRPADERD